MEDSIVIKLKEIFMKRYGLDFDQVAKEDYDVSFFEPIYGFGAADMLYLYFDVEKEFSITIPEKDIESNRLFSFNGIVSIVKEQLKAA